MAENEHIVGEQWLRRLGCPVELTPTMLSSLDTLGLRPMWRHLQSTLKPVEEAKLIRRNLVRVKLRNRSQDYPSVQADATKFKIESIEELACAEIISEVEHDIIKLKDKIMSVNENIHKESGIMLGKIAKLKSMKLHKKEVKTKTNLLHLKANRMKKDTEKLAGFIFTARGLNMHCGQKLSPAERKHNSSVAAKYVVSHACGVECRELLQVTTTLPAPVVFNGILHVTNRALRSFRANMDTTIPSNFLKEKISDTGILFSQHLNNLKALVMRNDIEYHRSTERIKCLTIELQKASVALQDLLKITGSEHKDVVNFVDALTDNAIISHKMQILEEAHDKLEYEVFELDHFKKLITAFEKEEETLNKDLQTRVNQLNRLTETIYESEVSVVRTEVRQKCADTASAFLAQQRKQGSGHVCMELENLMKDDMEIFFKTPLVAMTRSWEQNSLVSSDVIQDLSAKQTFRRLLLQSEPANIIGNVLELICLSQSFEHEVIRV